MKEYKLITSRHKSRRSPLLPEAQHREPRLLNAARQTDEIAVARDDAEAIDPAREQQFHGVHDQRGIARVFALRIVELLHRPNAQPVQALRPRSQRAVGPVAIRPAHRGPAALVHQLHELRGAVAAHVLGIDQHRQARAGDEVSGVARGRLL